MVIRRRGLGKIAIEIRVRRALRALRASPIDGVLIGDLAMNLYRNPRYTAEIHLLMRCGLPATPPAGFMAIAPHKWQHDASGILGKGWHRGYRVGQADAVENLRRPVAHVE